MAITGTSFSVTEAIRFIPPIKMKPATSAKRIPTIIGLNSTPKFVKTFDIEPPMEFA